MIQQPNDKEYDVFVSYRSEDIHIVRPIAEHMMAAGLKVWFAEYKILLAGREHFEKAIAYGIANCSYGLCFTNDRYASSIHCKKELHLLLITLGPDRIVEIRCPHQPKTYEQFPDLKLAAVFEYTDKYQVLKDIQSATGLNTYSSWIESPAPTYRFSFSSGGLRYSLDFGGWRIKKHLFSWIGGDDHRIVTYQHSLNDSTLRGHLIAGPMDVSRSSLHINKERDDRAYYDRALKFADSFYQTNFRQAPIGVHLSFIPRHISQAAISTQFAPGVISRLYSVVLERSRNRTDMELTFFFFYKGNIQDFWRHAYFMDRLIQSLQVKNQPQRAIAENRKRYKKYGHTGNRLLFSGRINFFPLNRYKSWQLGKAVLRNDLHRLRILLNCGADPNRLTIAGQDPKGRRFKGTPLMVAAAEGLKLIVVTLLKHGCAVDYRDSRGWTALFFASENGYEKICKLLLHYGANPNNKSVQSGTALMAAAIKGHVDIVRLLLKNGADISIRDSIGKSALDFANKYGHSEIVSILRGLK